MISVPEGLREKIKKRQVLPFAGAGVSMAIKSTDGKNLFPSWEQLLQRAAGRLRAGGKHQEADYIQAALKQSRYQEAAGFCRKQLKNADWVDFLKQQLDPPLADAVDESLDLPRAMWRLGSNLVVTTNFDWSLHWTCPEPKELRIWDVEAAAEQTRLLRDGTTRSPTIWHLHGHIENAGNMILTRDAYKRLYGSEGTALQVLRSQFAARSFLFIGFSLRDEAFGAELRWAENIFKEHQGTHYALLHVSEARELHYKNLEPIYYSDFDDALLNVVQDLARTTGLEPTTEPTDADEIGRRGRTASTSPGSPGDTPLADLQINVDVDLAGSVAALKYDLTTPHPSIKLPTDSIPGQRLLNWPAFFHDDVAARLWSLGSGLDVDKSMVLSSEAKEKIEIIGRRLFQELFPAELVCIYKENRDKIRSIHITSNETVIPWEALKPFDDTEPMIDDDFLGSRFAITRWLSGVKRPPKRIAAKGLAIFDASNAAGFPALDAAERERSYVEDTITTALSELRNLSPGFSTRESMQSLLRSKSADIIHLLGHGHNDLARPYMSGAVMADGSIFRAEDLSGRTGAAVMERRPFVFANICLARGAFAEAWVRMQCGMFIGPLWPVKDRLALAFVKEFYDCVIRKRMSFGEAAQRSRKAVRHLDSGNPAWLAFSVFGHPGGQLCSRGSR